MSDELPHENHEPHKEWRQGDFALASGPFLFADVPDAEGELMAAVYDDPDPAGLVVISQTCDVVSTPDKLSTVVVCPLMAVKPEHLDMIAGGRAPRFGFIENAPEGLVADFGRLMSIVSLRPDCSAADRVGRIVSALDGGHYGVLGGSTHETALD